MLEEFDLSKYSCQANYICQSCEEKGICEDGVDAFAAGLCQVCYEKLWGRYVVDMQKCVATYNPLVEALSFAKAIDELQKSAGQSQASYQQVSAAILVLADAAVSPEPPDLPELMEKASIKNWDTEHGLVRVDGFAYIGAVPDVRNMSVDEIQRKLYKAYREDYELHQRLGIPYEREDTGR